MSGDTHLRNTQFYIVHDFYFFLFEIDSPVNSSSPKFFFFLLKKSAKTKKKKKKKRRDFCGIFSFLSLSFLVFEADVEENDEYQKVYQEYKNLVDLLLGCFMEDMGITPEQFEYACTVNKYTKMPIQFQQASRRNFHDRRNRYLRSFSSPKNKK